MAVAESDNEEHLLYVILDNHVFFFNLQFFFIHNDKPKTTNSAVIHKEALYHKHNYKFSLKCQ